MAGTDYHTNLDDNREVEQEHLYPKDAGEISEPFDPKDVDIVPSTMTVFNLVERLRNGEIKNLSYQRNPDLWDDGTQSRLIESLIIRIPLPTFYFASADNDDLIVVDGLQRLTTLRRFMVLGKDDPDRLRLVGLEYLEDFEGKVFDELPPPIQRRIREQNLSTYVIRKGTPKKVLNSIFKRINTGGLVLTPAEIKNAIYQDASPFVAELASSPGFIEATRNSVKPDRMLDREFVNRFLAFYMLGLDKYKGNLEDYLCDALEFIQEAPRDTIEDARTHFMQSMDLSCELFGRNAFRKLGPNGNYSVINKPLFDCVSVNLARLQADEGRRLLERKDVFLKGYRGLLGDGPFLSIISMGTATKENVGKRHEAIRNLIKECVK